MILEKELLRKIWLDNPTPAMAQLLTLAETWYDELFEWRCYVADTPDAAMEKIQNLNQNLDEARGDIEDLTNDIRLLTNKSIGSKLREIAFDYEELASKLDKAIRDERNATSKMKEYKEKLSMWNALSL